MDIRLQEQQDIQNAKAVFNALKKIIEAPQNKIFVVESATRHMDCDFEVYSSKGDLIFKCAPGAIEIGEHYVALPRELNNSLIAACEKRGIKDARIKKVQAELLLSYLQKYRG